MTCPAWLKIISKLKPLKLMEVLSTVILWFENLLSLLRMFYKPLNVYSFSDNYVSKLKLAPMKKEKIIHKNKTLDQF